jgi:predicted nucleotidyltransferase
MSVLSTDNLPNAEIGDLCEQFGVAKLSIFGSVARDAARPDSDVDVLYEMCPGRQMGFIAMDHLAESLSKLLDGRRVDLARADQLHWYIRPAVMREAKVIYAR